MFSLFRTAKKMESGRQEASRGESAAAGRGMQERPVDTTKICGVAVSDCTVQVMTDFERGVHDRHIMFPHLGSWADPPTREQLMSEVVQEIQYGYDWPPPMPDTGIRQCIRNMEDRDLWVDRYSYVAVFEVQAYPVGITSMMLTTADQRARSLPGHPVKRNYSYKFRLVRALPTYDAQNHEGRNRVMRVDTTYIHSNRLKMQEAPAGKIQDTISFFESMKGDWVSLTELLDTPHEWLCSHFLPEGREAVVAGGSDEEGDDDSEDAGGGYESEGSPARTDG